MKQTNSRKAAGKTKKKRKGHSGWRGPGRGQIRRQCFSYGRWILFALIPAHFAALTFLGQDSPPGPLSASGALLIGSGLARLFRMRQEQVLLIQYLHLLGYLSTRLAAGIPLEAAFREAADSLVEQLGRQNPIIRSLMKLKKNLEAQMVLSEALDLFAEEVNLPVCRRDFTLLIMLARTGGRIDVFVRQIHQDLAAQISAQEEVANERRGHSSEAVIMSVIPFFVARMILDPASSYGQSMADAPHLVQPLSLLYLASVLALFILLLLLAPERTRPKGQGKSRQKKGPKQIPQKTRLTRLLSRLYLDWLPGQLGTTVSSAVLQLAENPDQAWLIYLHQKSCDLFYGCLLAFLSALTGRLPWLLIAVIPLLFSGLRDVVTCRKASRQKNEYRFFYPSVISSLHSLLESGLTLDRSLRMTARVKAAGNPDNPVSQALNRTSLLLQTGYDGATAVSHLADRCPLPEIQAALRLMARYQREGGGEILDLIRMESDRSRQLYRDALRGRSEERSILFMIPMAMDLLIVMVTVALPAVVSIRSIL